MAYEKVNFIARDDTKPDTYLVDGVEKQITKDDSGLVLAGTPFSPIVMDVLDQGIKDLDDNKQPLATNNDTATAGQALFSNGDETATFKDSKGFLSVISETTLPSDTSQIDVVVPSGYKLIRLLLYTKSSTAGNARIYLNFNDDFGSNYLNKFGAGSTDKTDPDTKIRIGNLSCESLSTDSFGISDIKIPTMNTADSKTIYGNSYSETSSTENELIFGVWRNTTEDITKVNLTLTADQFAAGSKIILLGGE